jgi:hypothetical protein
MRGVNRGNVFCIMDVSSIVSCGLRNARLAP